MKTWEISVSTKKLSKTVRTSSMDMHRKLLNEIKSVYDLDEIYHEGYKIVGYKKCILGSWSSKRLDGVDIKANA